MPCMLSAFLGINCMLCHGPDSQRQRMEAMTWAFVIDVSSDRASVNQWQVLLNS